MDSQHEREQVATGVVVEALPNTTFKVELDDNTQVLAYLSGKMRMNRIKVLIGDKVSLELDEYRKRGRITRRN